MPVISMFFFFFFLFFFLFYKFMEKGLYLISERIGLIITTAYVLKSFQIDLDLKLGQFASCHFFNYVVGRLLKFALELFSLFIEWKYWGRI